jgi:hypothetical protein
MEFQGDVLNCVLQGVNVLDLTKACVVARSWKSDAQAQRRLQLGRLAAHVVNRIRKTEHNARAFQNSLQSDCTISVLEESMDLGSFRRLFGHLTAKTQDDMAEIKLIEPRHVLAALPDLPVVVSNVANNAPICPWCPLVCLAGYVDGYIKYDRDLAKLVLSVRSRAIKLCPYWEASAPDLDLSAYMDEAVEQMAPWSSVLTSDEMQ